MHLDSSEKVDFKGDTLVLTLDEKEKAGNRAVQVFLHSIEFEFLGKLRGNVELDVWKREGLVLVVGENGGGDEGLKDWIKENEFGRVLVLRQEEGDAVGVFQRCTGSWKDLELYVPMLTTGGGEKVLELAENVLILCVLTKDKDVRMQGMQLAESCWKELKNVGMELPDDLEPPPSWTDLDSVMDDEMRRQLYQ